MTARRGLPNGFDKITLTIERPKLTPEDEKRLMEAARSNEASE